MAAVSVHMWSIEEFTKRMHTLFGDDIAQEALVRTLGCKGSIVPMYAYFVAHRLRKGCYSDSRARWSGKTRERIGCLKTLAHGSSPSIEEVLLTREATATRQQRCADHLAQIPQWLCDIYGAAVDRITTHPVISLGSTKAGAGEKVSFTTVWNPYPDRPKAKGRPKGFRPNRLKHSEETHLNVANSNA